MASNIVTFWQHFT